VELPKLVFFTTTEIKGSGFFQKGFNGPFTESATFYFEK